MIYPAFIKKGDTIGICALSAGVGKKIDEYETSLSVLKKEGYKIKETASVRAESPRSASALVRAEELDELVSDPDVRMIIAATGGDVQLETVPYIDYESIKKDPKWIMGYSDPTNLLFPVTTMLDIATIYGFNASSYDERYEKEQLDNLSIIKGDLIKQTSFERYRDFIDVIKDNDDYKEVLWRHEGELDLKGRCIGGCLDTIQKLVGTEYDYVNDFIDRYKNDGIIWYFDNFALSAYDTYLSLLQLKTAGYFRHCKAVLFGRVAFPSTEGSDIINDYEEAYKTALEDIPYISEMDIGHTRPRMTMINGAIINVRYKDHKGEISFSFEDNEEKGVKEMAIIKCPECGREISDLASECIHCGYPLRQEEELVSIVDNLSTISSETVIEAYDVMLVDYDDSKIVTATNLKRLLDITYREAYSILATLPSYIYNDIPQEDAEYIARKLMNMNMRVAVYDPVGNVRYYEPPIYINRPLPIVAPMPRVKRVVRPNPIIHHHPFPSPSPIVIKNYYNNGPKKNPPMSKSPFGNSKRSSPVPKMTSPKKTTTAPKITVKNTAPKSVSRNTSSRPMPSSSSRTQRPASSRSAGNRLASSNSRGKR